MTDNDLITAFTNELTIDRTSENIGAAWLRKGAGAAAVESRTPFWFTGPENALRSQLCESLGKAKERVFISSSSLSEPTVLQALSSVVQRCANVHFLDKVGFEEALTNTIASPLHGTATDSSANHVAWMWLCATGTFQTNGGWCCPVRWTSPSPLQQVDGPWNLMVNKLTKCSAT